MAHYIDADKLKAEIERRIKEYEATYPKGGYWFPEQEEAYAIAEEYKQLLSFLDTLQEQEVKEQKAQDTVGRVSVEIRSNLQTDEVVRKTLIMLVNDGRISVTGAITSSDILDWLEGQKEPEVDLDSKVTFDCISKKVTMSIRELINYYIDRECCDVAEECGF